MNGYNGLAALMARYPDLGILRRFETLDVRNLLILNAELVLLEDDLKDTIRRDAASRDPDRIRLQYDVGALLESNDDADLDKSDQARLTLQIRHKLKEYQEAVLLSTAFKRLPAANKRDVQSLRKYLDKAADLNSLFLSGTERRTWSERNDGDFLTLAQPAKEEDAMTIWINKSLVPWLHEAILHKTKQNISLADAVEKGHTPTIPLQHYSDTAAATVVNLLSTILSSLWPTAAIFALYFIKPPLAKLSAIMAFTFLFSAMITIMTRARRIDCFTATAAFSAVLVVFVGSNNTP